MSELELTVIVPVYNREGEITKCLDSIAEQSLPQHLFEVIVVDDCSTDRTTDVISKYSKIENLRLITLSENSGGASKPRNIGIDLALGKYIVFIDSDDTITSEALRLALNLAQKENLDMVIIPVFFGEGRNSYTTLFEDYPKGIKKALFSTDKEIGELVFTNPGVIGRLYRSELLKNSGVRFSEKLSIYEDTLFSRFVFSISESVGMLSTDDASYIPTPASNEMNLSLLKRTVERCVLYLVEAIRICQEIPDTSISSERKKRILNNSFCRNNIYKTVDTPRGYEELAKHFNLILPYLFDDGIRAKAKELIRKVCNFKSLQERLLLAESYFQGNLCEFSITTYYQKVWVWRKDVVVVEFNIQGYRFAVNIYPGIEGYHLIELIARGDSIKLDIEWEKYGLTKNNRIQLFYHPACLGLHTAFVRISQILSLLAKEVLNKSD